jgi:hypothetical protein
MTTAEERVPAAEFAAGVLGGGDDGRIHARPADVADRACGLTVCGGSAWTLAATHTLADVDCVACLRALLDVAPDGGRP